jgi:ribosomal protein S18 acetylase RimI-like enzyme
MIEISQASQADFPQIQQVAYQTWPATYGTILSEEQLTYMLKKLYSIESLKEQAENKAHHFIMAKNGEKCVGFASYELDYKNSTTTKIHKLYVLPDTQGQGIGKLLINRVAELAKQSGNDVLSLNVNRHNPSIQFYERFGFSKVQEENIPIGNGFFMEDFIMEKQLSM